MTYDVSFFSTATNWFHIFDGLISSGGGLIGGIILVLIAIIGFLVMLKFGAPQAAIASMFLTSVISVMFFTIEWIPIGVMIATIVLLLVPTFMIIVKR